MFGLLNCCCCCVDENIIDCGCWNIGGRTNDCCCCCCWVGKNIDDCCWVDWVGVIKKSKSFDEVLFVVVDTVEGTKGWKRSFDGDVVGCNDSNGSNAVDDDGVGTDEVVVGQIEGWILK